MIEDIDAEPQLREVKDHLDDVVLKKLSLEYLSGRDTSAFLPKSLTKTQFKVFHQVRTYCGAHKPGFFAPLVKDYGLYALAHFRACTRWQCLIRDHSLLNVPVCSDSLSFDAKLARWFFEYFGKLTLIF